MTHLEKESAITQFQLSESQIESIWNHFGGSPWEISAFLGDLLRVRKDHQISDANFEKQLLKVMIEMRSLFEDFARLDIPKIKLFQEIHKSIQRSSKFKFNHLYSLIQNRHYDSQQLTDILNELVRRNFLAYDLVTTEYSVQGRSMEIGLAMYIELSKDFESLVRL